MNFYQLSPKHFIEFFILTLFCILFLLFNNSDSNYSNLTFLLGMYVVAILRLMPSINRSINAIQQLRYGSDFLKNLKSTIFLNSKNTLFDSKKKEELVGDNILNLNRIKLDDVSFSYDGKKILENINLKLSKGKIYLFIGESGIGKSTLIEIILGLIKLQKGKIVLNGSEILNFANQQKLQAYQSRVAFFPQNTFLFDGTIKENLIIGSGVRDFKNINQKMENVIKISGLDEYLKKENGKLNFEKEVLENGNNMSGGQKQRLGIAKALMKNPDFIFFDEPTSSLDKKTSEKLSSSLSKLRATQGLIIISHQVEIFEDISDEIYQIKNFNLDRIK